MGKLSRSKGKRGELEVVGLIEAHGFSARRGQQHRGGSDSPDIIHDMVNLEPAGTTLHLEVKRRERVNLYDALDQAAEDAGEDAMASGGVPVVFHRRDQERWLVTLDANDFLDLVRDMHSREGD